MRHYKYLSSWHILLSTYLFNLRIVGVDILVLHQMLQYSLPLFFFGLLHWVKLCWTSRLQVLLRLDMHWLVHQNFPAVVLDPWHDRLLCGLRITHIETLCHVWLVKLFYPFGHEQVRKWVSRLGVLECLIWASERLVVHLESLLEVIPPLYLCLLYIAFPWCHGTTIDWSRLHGPGSCLKLTVSCRYQILRVECGEGTGCLGIVNAAHVYTRRVAHDPGSICQSTDALDFSYALHALLEQALLHVISVTDVIRYEFLSFNEWCWFV